MLLARKKQSVFYLWLSITIIKDWQMQVRSEILRSLNRTSCWLAQLVRVKHFLHRRWRASWMYLSRWQMQQRLLRQAMLAKMLKISSLNYCNQLIIMLKKPSVALFTLMKLIKLAGNQITRQLRAMYQVRAFNRPC